MGLRWDLGVVELHFSRHGWGWDVTWMEVRCKFKDLNWGETRPGWSWDFNMGVCIEVRCEYGGLDWIEIQPRWRRDANLWTLMETVHGWRWGTNLATWTSLSRTRMEVRRTYWNLDGFEMVPGWIWDATWGDWNQVKYHLVQGQIYGPGLRWDAIWMGRRREFMSLDWGKTSISGNAWGFDRTWIELSCISWFMERLE